MLQRQGIKEQGNKARCARLQNLLGALRVLVVRTLFFISSILFLLLHQST
jgi:hypothetical protein